MRKIGISKLIPLTLGVLIALFISCISINPAKAYSNERLIDDAVFDNTGTMDTTAIQNFLNQFPNSCLKNYSDDFPNDYFSYSTPVSAATVIKRASDLWGVNPQVLLAKLEQESNLVTGSGGCQLWRYISAMGYNCPDHLSNNPRASTFRGTPVLTCVGQDADMGLSRQLTKGSWLLKFAKERSNDNLNWLAPDDGNIQYYGRFVSAGMHKRCVSCSPIYDDGTFGGYDIQTGATASLYNYTPHIPSSFPGIFEGWFGSTFGGSYTIIKSSTSDAQYVYEGGSKRIIPSVAVKIAWNLQDQQVITYPQGQVDAIPYRDTKPLSILGRIDGSQAVYLIDKGHKYVLPSPASLQAWAFDPNAIVNVGMGLGSKPGYSGVLGYSIRSSDANDQRIFMVDGGTLKPYASLDVLLAWEGNNPFAVSPSTDLFASQGPISTTITTTKVSNASTEYQVVAGQRLAASPTLSSLYPGSALPISNATIARLVPGVGASWFVRGSTDQTVYLIDGGTKHSVASWNHLIAWSPNSAPNINVVTNAAINLIPTGSPLTQFVANQSGQYYYFTGQKLPVPANLATEFATSTLGSLNVSAALMSLYANGPQATNFFKGVGGPAVYLLDGGTRRAMPNWDTYSLWNGSRSEPLTVVYDFALSQFSLGSGVSFLINNGTNSFVLDNGTYYQLDATSNANWGFGVPVPITPATLNRFTNGGALSNAAHTVAGYYLMRNARSFFSVNLAVIGVWNITSTQVHSDTLARQVISAGVLQPFFALTDSNDQRIFVKDSDKVYPLTSPTQLYNYGYNNAILPKISSTELSSLTVGANARNIVSLGSQYLALDRGAKRPAMNVDTQSAWGMTTSGNFMPITSSLAGYFTSGAIVSRLVKGSGGTVYEMVNGNKRGIPSQAYLQQNYPGVPITNLSDTALTLITTIP